MIYIQKIKISMILKVCLHSNSKFNFLYNKNFRCSVLDPWIYSNFLDRSWKPCFVPIIIEILLWLGLDRVENIITFTGNFLVNFKKLMIL